MGLLSVVLLAVVLNSTPSGPGLKGASKVNDVLAKLKSPKPAKSVQKFQLSEADINDFIQAAIKSKQRLGVKSIRLDLAEAGRLQAVATVNMDDVKLNTTGTWLFKKLLSGRQVLKVEGKLITRKGKARYELEKAEMNGIWVPAWLATAVVGFVGKNQPPNIDVTEEFDLPYGIADVVVHADRLDILR